MKKLFTLMVVVLIATSSFAQQLENQFYFRFGYSNPSWKQFDLDQDLWEEFGDDASKMGASFELGSIFMLNGILPANNMAFGINVDYLYANFNSFSFDEFDYTYGIQHLRLGSKIGPSFTYSPVDKMAIDAYVKADISWATFASDFEDGRTEIDDSFLGFGAVGLSTGLNFRYGLLILGFEYNKVSPELEHTDSEFEGVYMQQMMDEIFDKGHDRKKSPLPFMNFTIGLSF